MSESFLYQLMNWFSPSYPIGSFNYSHGIEYAVEGRLIKTAEDLKEWIQATIVFGTGRMDAVLFKVMYETFQQSDLFSDKDFEDIITVSNALKPSPELWAESNKQGEAALKILLETYPSIALTFLKTALKKTGKKPTMPIVFGVICAERKIPLPESLIAFLHSFAANLVSAGLKLIPLGQTDGQKITAALEAPLRKTVALALQSNLEEIGGATPMVDWTSVKHETQYTRLFQS